MIPSIRNPKSEFPNPKVYLSRAMLRNRSYRPSISARLSLPNFSVKAQAISKATTFSTITLAAEMAQTSLRS